MEVFVVDRDPRDMFVTNKYVYPALNEQVPYPIDAYEFCKCYKALRKMESNVNENDTRIHRLHFEDLIYNYDNSVDKIKKILYNEKGEVPLHLEKKKYFNPDRSINNTQLFWDENGECREEYRDEIKIIETNLAEYLYEFPYKRISSNNGVF